jgi:hypothetical protein
LSADLAQHIPEVAGNWLSRIRETLTFICPVRCHFLGRRMENMENMCQWLETMEAQEYKLEGNNRPEPEATSLESMPK